MSYSASPHLFLVHPSVRANERSLDCSRVFAFVACSRLCMVFQSRAYSQTHCDELRLGVSANAPLGPPQILIGAAQPHNCVSGASCATSGPGLAPGCYGLAQCGAMIVGRLRVRKRQRAGRYGQPQSSPQFSRSGGSSRARRQLVSRNSRPRPSVSRMQQVAHRATASSCWATCPWMRLRCCVWQRFPI